MYGQRGVGRSQVLYSLRSNQIDSAHCNPLGWMLKVESWKLNVLQLNQNFLFLTTIFYLTNLILVFQTFRLQVSPWLEIAVASIKDSSVCPQPPADTWKGWKGLAQLEHFGTMKALIDAFAALAQCSLAFKAETAVAADMDKNLSLLKKAHKSLKEWGSNYQDQEHFFMFDAYVTLQYLRL